MKERDQRQDSLDSSCQKSIDRLIDKEDSPVYTNMKDSDMSPETLPHSNSLKEGESGASPTITSNHIKKNS